MTEQLHFHFSLSCIGEGNGNPLQCSCLENPRDWGAWWAVVYGVAQSRTRLKRLSSSSKPLVSEFCHLPKLYDLEQNLLSLSFLIFEKSESNDCTSLIELSRGLDDSHAVLSIWNQLSTHWIFPAVIIGSFFYIIYKLLENRHCCVYH